MKNVLIIGASGFLGREIYNAFQSDSKYTSYGTYTNKYSENLHFIDITNITITKELINKIKPDIIIIVAAITNVELCEVNKEYVDSVNIEGIRNISLLCKEHNVKIVYISSDYVFDGENGPYSEDDTPNPINYYGKTKLIGENLIQNYFCNYLIVRTTVVYGWDLESKNFIMQLIGTLSEKKVMRVPNDQIGSPTYCPDLAYLIKLCCDRNINGILNIVGNDIIDRYNFALEAADILNLDKSLIIPISTCNLGQKAKRPLNAGLKTDKLKALLSVSPLGTQAGLYEIKKNLKLF